MLQVTKPSIIYKNARGKKNAWLELVGIDGNIAATIIDKQNKHVKVIVLKDGTPVTKDINCVRVWFWVDENNVVIRTPTFKINI
ncbi:hypothetical protein MANES_05G086392v8 [Manihot esculenta]|uniref:Uncharacterized protein n=1 Tax=Manihot esculenta TaxID=3983 RepID=A0ACB7HQ86_MANES|nr:hypothetical protein MANES_05G086392v8 [Manihot esculenta]